MNSCSNTRSITEEKVGSAITWGIRGKGSIVCPNVTENERKSRMESISKVAMNIYESVSRRTFNIPNNVNICFNIRDDIDELQITPTH